MEKADDNTLIIKIDAYLKGHLSEEEHTAFAQQIAADEDLAAQVEQQKVHLEALDILLEDDLRSKMKVWELENDENQNRSTWKIWAFGFFAVTTAIGLFFLLKSKNQVENPSSNPKNQQSDTLRQQNAIDTTQIKLNPTFQPKKATPSVSKPQQPIAAVQTLPNEILATANSDIALVINELENSETKRGKESDTLLSASYRLVRQKNYSQALNLLKNVTNTEGVFVQAVTYFLDRQFAKALSLFDNLSKNRGFDRSEMAEYYAALCFLANGQRTEAIKRLTKIADDKGHPYSTNAKMVLKQM